jgi:hypothetical protein
MLLCADSPDLIPDLIAGDPMPIDVVVLACGNTGAVSAAG